MDRVLGMKQLGKTAVFEFWKVCRLHENEAWWGEINSSSLPAVPVSRGIFPSFPRRLRLALI